MESKIKNGFELLMQIDKMFNIEEEYWRVIKEYPNYSVSTYGNVRNDNTGRILKSNKNTGGYLKVNLCENSAIKSCRIHKLVSNAFIMNGQNKKCVDHMDNNKMNNNIGNLRWATYTENSRNMSIHKDNTSGFKGVTFDKKSKRWKAGISIKGKQTHIGCYKTSEEASKAYQQYADEYYGEFANY